MRSVPTAFSTLAIKAIPNAPRSEVIGWLGDALKVKVYAPPVESRATLYSPPAPVSNSSNTSSQSTTTAATASPKFWK